MSTFSARGSGLRSRGRHGVTVLLCSFLLVSGCGWFSETIQVNPAALDDVRGIGKVWGEASSKSAVGWGAEITNKLVIDVKSSSAREALDRATDLLRKREWKVVAQNVPTMTLMESVKWVDTHLTIAPFHSAYLENDPGILKRIKDGAVRAETLVIVNVYVRT